MSLTHKLDIEKSLIEITIDGPVSIQDIQNAMPQIVKDVNAQQIFKWILIVKTQKKSKSVHDLGFTEFTFNELKRYIQKIAVVCYPDFISRVREVLAPIENQEKPVGIFSSIDDARDWLSD